MPEQDSLSTIFDLLRYGFSTAVRVAKRVFVHLCCMIAALIFAASSEPGHSAFAAWLAAYAGLVCFIPMSTGSEAPSERMIPPLAGASLLLCWVALGVPWQFVPYWGGLAAWGTRLLLRPGGLRWEWLDIPLIIIGFFPYLPPSAVSVTNLPFWSLPFFAGGGWLAGKLYGLVRGQNIRRELLTASCKKLSKKLDSKTLPDALRIGAIQLEKQGRDLLNSGLARDSSYEPLVRSLAAVTDGVCLADSRSKEPYLKELEAGVSALNQDLFDRLQELRQSQAPKSHSPLDLRLEAFAQSIRALLVKAPLLPESVRGQVFGIGKAAHGILRCMREDPADMTAGDRFLSRYLKAAHTVVDEYAKLVSRNGMQEGSTELLARSGELLRRLEAAFIQEQSSLLRNDTITFTAELNVLDKLLKMDGK